MPPLQPPRGIKIAAFIAAIGSGLAISVGVFTLLAGSSAIGSGPVPSQAFLVALPLLMIAFGAWGLATARGLLRIEPWARISVLVFSVLLAFLGAMGTFFLLSGAKIPIPPGISPEEFEVVRKVITVIYFAFLVLGVWWLLEFNSPEVRATFRGGQRIVGEVIDAARAQSEISARRFELRSASKAASRARPLSITVIGWYLLAGTASSAVQVLMGVPASIFGMTLAGPSASLLYLAMFAAQAYLGIGLLQLQPLSRVLSVYFFLFGFVNTALFVGLPGREARLAAMVRAFPSAMQPAPGAQPATAWWLPLISAAIGAALPIWFLVTRKSVFTPPAPPPPQEQQ